MLPLTLGGGCVEAKACGESWSARRALLVLDLVADGARDAIGGRQAGGIVTVAQGKVAEDLAPVLPSALAWKRAIGMWQAEHSFWMAAEAAGWTIVSRRTAACQ